MNDVQFKEYLRDTMKQIRKGFVEAYADKTNDALSIYIDKSGYMTAFSFDKDEEKILNVTVIEEE